MAAIDAVTLSAAVVLAGANLLPRYLGPLHGPRTRPVVSLFGGVAAAYVFLHLLPMVADGQGALEDSVVGDLPVIEQHAFVLAFVGLLTFFLIEIAARGSRRRGDDASSRAELQAFAGALVGFALHNVLLGYLVVEQGDADGAGAVIALVVALAVHVAVNDASLREHHRERYERVGRWVLVAGVLVGWFLGRAADLSEAAVAGLLAFLAGGIALNVLKEELPGEREGHFVAFTVGALFGAVLLVPLLTE